MKICVFDIEADGLNPSKIHCLTASVYSQGEWRLKSTTDYDEMRKFFLSADVLVGHNIARWDIPVVERLLDIKITAKIRDTLFMSWYLYPERLQHGLEWWGEHFGVPKPKVDDWENLPIEEYIHRCEEDVKINCKLWDQISKDLFGLYDKDEKEVERLLDYLEFKSDCAREAEASRWKLDVARCISSLEELEDLKEEKMDQLRKGMPPVQVMATVSRPDSLYQAPKVYKKPATFQKNDGSLSSAGEKYKMLCEHVGQDPYTTDVIQVPSKELSKKGLAWLDLLEQEGLPETHTEDITYVKSSKEANPNSVPQVKDWLYGLGWVPINFDYKDDREIPQIRIEEDGVKVLCPSVRNLIKIDPVIEALDGLTVLSHRIGILKGYLENMDGDGYVKAAIQGLTNTLRFKHKVVVNLPSVQKAYGEIVRGCLIAPEGFELCGSDMSSLEDRTKQHYMWKFDPDYVIEMQTPDFDPHLALAEFAGALTPEQVQSHKDCGKYKKLYKNTLEQGLKEEAEKYRKLYEVETDYSGERHLYKTANYSCTYGAGGKKLSLTLDIPEQQGMDIVAAYRAKNWAISAIAQDQLIKFFYRLSDGTLTYKLYKGIDLIATDADSKQVRREKYNLAKKAEMLWLFNPVSKFWYSLRFPKDIFSTLNQGTGVFCFDSWIKKFREKRKQLTGQFHDEIILTVRKGHREACEKLLKDAIKETNEELKLNRELDVDVQFGDNYAEIH